MNETGQGNIVVIDIYLAIKKRLPSLTNEAIALLTVADMIYKANMIITDIVNETNETKGDIK